jgi:hypothetical protein
MQTAPARRRRGRLAGLTAALAGLVATVVSGAAFAVPGVTPATVTATLLPGQSNVQAKSVETSPIPPRPDIVFLADTTGSMGGALVNVRDNATAIMNTVRAAQADSQFGVAAYKDFGDVYVYNLFQAVTDSIPAAQAGTNAWLPASGGGNTPEANINALFNVAQNATGWRAGSSRILVWFGDASGHDPSGGHTLADAIAALNTNNIKVIAINVASGGADGLNATGQAAAVATATGGMFFPSATNDQVADAILEGLTNLPVTVTHSVNCPAGVFANLTPASQTGTSGQRSRSARRTA